MAIKISVQQLADQINTWRGSFNGDAGRKEAQALARQVMKAADDNHDGSMTREELVKHSSQIQQLVGRTAPVDAMAADLGFSPIAASVGQGGVNRPADRATTVDLLQRAGALPRAQATFTDAELVVGIKKFQHDHNLLDQSGRLDATDKSGTRVSVGMRELLSAVREAERVRTGDPLEGL